MSASLPTLSHLASRMESGHNLDFQDGLALYQGDLTELGQLAQHLRIRLHGRCTYFVQSRRLSWTNVCMGSCTFCAFKKSPSETSAYVLSPADVLSELGSTIHPGVTELHMTAGLHPQLDVLYFEELFRAIKEQFPWLHIKALTMVELDFYARISGLEVETFIHRLKAAGLESCPGGGAEIFDADVRQMLCPDKMSAETWLEIAESCHRLGLPTNATMLYGHLETPEHKVDHLLRLRKLQDRTGGFQAFIPLPFLTSHNALAAVHGIKAPSLRQHLREIAVARLMLHNIPHIKAYWAMIGPEAAQIAQDYGADDLDGTLIREEIAHAAGAATPRGLTKKTLVHLIQSAGFEPVERDARYRVVDPGACCK